MRKIHWGIATVAMCLAGASAFAGAPEGAGEQLASPAGRARATLRPHDGGATVVVERREGQAWRPAWHAELRSAATDNVVLADDGHLLAFDDASLDGEHAIALFDARGQLVRELKLADFLPAEYVRALSHDDGHLHWRGGSVVSAADGSVEFSVPVPGAGTAPALQFSIGLQDGLVRTSQLREYIDAADAARKLASPAVASR
jgi:hypothetical protein